jgi:type IV pilus assembly protein PilA
MLRLLPVLALLACAGCDAFIKTGGRPRSHECKSNLKGWYTAERAFFQEKDRYSTSMSEIGFSPERGNRYFYVAALPGTLTDRSDPVEKSSRSDTGILPDVYKHGPKAAISPNQVPTHLAGNVRLGLTGQCPDNCQISAVCVAQLDGDPTLDIWSISTEPRKLPSGEEIYAGSPHNESNDVTH